MGWSLKKIQKISGLGERDIRRKSRIADETSSKVISQGVEIFKIHNAVEIVSSYPELPQFNYISKCRAIKAN